MKGRILSRLRAAPEVVSGAVLSSELGVSRVAVWKHIRGLQDCGYVIASSAKGYRLVDSGDPLFAWEFGPRADRIHYHEEAPSTMEIARDLARAGCPHLTVVIAGRQTQGRGRLRRVWHSRDGGLYFTVVLRPQLPTVLSPRINFAASLHLVRTVNELFGIGAQVKWPNDILLGDAKLAGMLSEMEAETDRVAYINVGIGLNVNNDPAADEPGAVSLRKILGRPVARREILAVFLDRLEAGLVGSLDTVIDEWRRCTLTLGRRVRVVTARQVIEGTAEAVDDNGGLRIRQDDGSRTTVIYGDCFLQ